MKLDALFISAHPDDVELSCGGTVRKLVKDGYKVGIIDLTQGELGTRGSKELRMRETNASTCPSNTRFAYAPSALRRSSTQRSSKYSLQGRVIAAPASTG